VLRCARSGGSLPHLQFQGGTAKAGKDPRPLQTPGAFWEYNDAHQISSRRRFCAFVRTFVTQGISEAISNPLGRAISALGGYDNS
jgi:hypothetical protein